MPQQYDAKLETTTFAEDGHGVSYRDLCDITTTRVEEILRLILLEMPQGELQTLVPAGLVLTGGSSNLTGLDAMGQEVLHLPVRIGAPMGIYGIADVLHDPAYATSVGLLMWGARRHEGEQKWQSQGVGKAFRHLFSRIRRLLIG